jgi:hypothetical protein
MAVLNPALLLVFLYIGVRLARDTGSIQFELLLACGV